MAKRPVLPAYDPMSWTRQPVKGAVGGLCCCTPLTSVCSFHPPGSLGVHALSPPPFSGGNQGSLLVLGLWPEVDPRRLTTRCRRLPAELGLHARPVLVPDLPQQPVTSPTSDMRQLRLRVIQPVIASLVESGCKP